MDPSMVITDGSANEASPVLNERRDNEMSGGAISLCTGRGVRESGEVEVESSL